MNKITRKLVILGLLTFGLFFTAFDSTATAGASSGTCQQCIELQVDCNQRCEEGGPGCNWCRRQVETCFRYCNW